MIGYPYLRLESTFQQLDADLTSIALLGSAADKMLYTTGANTWTETALTSAGRAILDDANAAAQATTLGLGVGSSVQHASLRVGTSTLKSGALFELAEDAANAEMVLSCYHDTEATTALLTLRKAEGTEASHTSVVDDNAVLGTILFQGYDGNTWANGAKIEARVQGTPGDADMPSELSFWTTPDASETLLQRVTILANGYVGFGQPAPLYPFHLETTNSTPFFITTDVGTLKYQILGTFNEMQSRNADDNAYRPFAWRSMAGTEPNMTLAITGNLGLCCPAAAGALSIGNNTEGRTASINIQTAHETHTLTLGATSTTTTIDVPDGAMVLGASFTVNTAVADSTGDDSWTAQLDGGDATSLGGGAPAQNTKVNTLIVPVIVNAETNVKFTPQGGNFSAGVIEVVVYYIDLTSLANV